jgi:hypothetical protein
MIRAARKKYLTISVLLPSVILAGCAQTPLGPTVMVMPGPGKSFDAFQTDQVSCKAYAADQVKGQADQANQQAVGAAVLTTVLGAGLGAAAGGFGGVAGQGAGLGAASGSLAGAAIGAQSSSMAQMGIQQQYDNAFSQCMYSKNDNVPGFAPRLAEAPSPGPVAAGPSPALVRRVQAELIRLNYLDDAADGRRSATSSDLMGSQLMAAHHRCCWPNYSQRQPVWGPRRPHWPPKAGLRR